ncbi:TIGR03943 family putative permease subunit [Amycolatopsis alkalitolerans]|uniref:TIGR03943 family protein n=1 Tax=Amycolatopsis alkalitolerans TaxID=2547244 RepID=A0A5C4M3A5_9PSEU|nr:TIGR03943 family protein [Amycolatopsis alkalitolerans]TNC27595.1 TIGR03943 family protein [Amycolatopsis alkalitolerans]
MRRETQNVLLVLLGGALLKIGINGDYLRYVKPSQQVWLLAGGAVMVALGAVAILRDLRSRGREQHGHHHPARSAWLLILPVLAVFLIAPPALGSDSVTRTEARAPAESQAAFPPLPPGDEVPLSLTEFITRAGWDPGGSLNGRTVQLTGFVTHSGGSVLLARMVITCCAADAYPLTVRMRGPVNYPNDTWLQITGRVVPGTATSANRYTPDFVLASLRRVAQPADPYED